MRTSIRALSRILMLSVAALVAGPSILLAQNPNPNAIDAATDKTDTALRDQLLASERQYWGAWQKQDWAAVRRMMGDDGIWVDPLNVFSTEGFIKVVKVGFGRAGTTPTANWPWLLHAVFANRSGQWVGVSRTEVRGNRPPAPPAGQ